MSISPTLIGPSRIVDDLVPLILESNDGHWWPRDLTRLAAISNAWLNPVRRRLYSSRIVLSSFTQTAQLVNTLQQNPDLAKYVQIVDLKPRADHEACLELFESDKDGCNAVQALLSLPSIRALTLGGELAVNAERTLSAVSGSSLEELTIDGHTLGLDGRSRSTAQPASLAWDESLAFKLRHVRKLTLRRADLRISPPSIPNYNLSLSELTLDRVTIASGMLAHLAHGSWSTLRELNVAARSATEFDEHVFSALPLCAENLYSLHYDLRDAPRRGEPGLLEPASLPPLPSLRQLHLSNAALDTDGLALVRDRCQELLELAVLGRASRVSADEWAEFMSEDDNLPKLRVLQPPGGTQGPPFVHWTEVARQPLRKSCARRYVELRQAFNSNLVPRSPASPPSSPC